jgi:hypothetical protein
VESPGPFEPAPEAEIAPATEAVSETLESPQPAPAFEESPPPPPFEPEPEPEPGHAPAPPQAPASMSAIQEAIKDVDHIIETLRATLDDMEEVLETLELAERQKDADEREIEQLQRSLRQFHRPQDGRGHRR